MGRAIYEKRFTLDQARAVFLGAAHCHGSSRVEIGADSDAHLGARRRAITATRPSPEWASCSHHGLADSSAVGKRSQLPADHRFAEGLGAFAAVDQADADGRVCAPGPHFCLTAGPGPGPFPGVREMRPGRRRERRTASADRPPRTPPRRRLSQPRPGEPSGSGIARLRPDRSR